MKLIDTNIIIYALGQEHLYREPCLRLLDRIAQGETGYTIDVELLQEVMHVFWRRGNPRLAVNAFDRTLALFPEPLSINLRELVMARNLLQRYPAFPTRDAIHAACVFFYGLEGIVSADRHFDVVPELKRFDPGEV